MKKNNKGGIKGRKILRPPAEKTIENVRKMVAENQPLPTRYKFQDGKLYYSESIEKTNLVLKNGENMIESQKIAILNSSQEEFNQDIMTYQSISEIIWYYIPTKEEFEVIIETEHSNGHLGEKKLKKQLDSLRILYPNSEKIIHNHIKVCNSCQMVKSLKKISNVPYNSIISEYPAQHIYMDLSFMPKVDKQIGNLLI